MTNIRDPFNPDLTDGRLIHGYRLKRSARLELIDAYLHELQHEATGARHIHISSKDRENTFSVAFKTVPTDSTGVAHILEHTVLCGSRRFPVRDPFFSMLKRSLSTFMNAFTASDWTMYPFATQNRKDYYNLMSVYLDAVLFPKLEQLSFKQEGHRLEFVGNGQNRAEPRGDSPGMEYKGVVYNEMKGAMSSPDQVLARSLLNALYPQTTYHYNSGGDPKEIPALTYDQLKSFHARHYHPSNSRFYTYGNLPLERHLAYIDSVLQSFNPIDPQTDVSPQPRWDSPREHTFSYPLDASQDPQRKFQVCLAWLTTNITDTFEVLALSLLEHILLGNPASPLRKALIESGLGTDLSDATGFDADNRDTLFACGLKDVRVEDTDKIESLIMDVLSDLAQNGIDKRLVDSALHQVEFHRKEITNSPYPYGIKLLLKIIGSWLHDGDPLRILQFDADLDRLNRELAKGRFFETRIRRYLLDNQHRTRLVLSPDQEMAAREIQRVKQELSSVAESLDDATRERISADATALKQLQDTTEDVSCLPTLNLDDIPETVPTVAASGDYAHLPARCYRQATSGIFYTSAALGLGGLDEQLIPLVPFFCYALTKSGTALRDYTDLAQQIDATTGGIGFGAQARTRFDTDGTCTPFVELQAKCLQRKIKPMFDILEELLFQYNFTDMQRLQTLLMEYRAKLETMVIHSGHQLAISLSSRNFSTVDTLNETWKGIHHLKTIKTLSDDLTPDLLADLARRLNSLGQQLLHRENLQMALIGEDSAFDVLANIHSSDGLLAPTPPVQNRFGIPAVTPDAHLPHEGWSTSTAVSFVAQTFKTVRLDHTDSAALSVISRILRSLYLHREIREKGGAYGGFAIYKAENGLFSFGSYRDPHIAGTLATYGRAGEFLTAGTITDEDIKEAILQVCADFDKPDSPGPAAKKAFLREIVGLSDEKRLDFKRRLLAVDQIALKQVAERYFSEPQTGRAVAVISGDTQLQAANEKLSHKPLQLNRI